MTEAVDYGPLAALIGTWRGDKGMDTSPEPDGTEQNPYYETLLFEASGDVTNAEEQTLAVVRYHQVVTRQRDDKVFHNETGYWLWNAADGSIVQVFAIPRGVSVVAGGRVNDHGQIEVRAAVDDPDWSIAQTPFMRQKARTVAFEHRVGVSGDTLVYDELTKLEIYVRSFDHTDSNTLYLSLSADPGIR